MAKSKSKAPPGVASMSEKEVMEMMSKSSTNNPVMKQLIEQLRSQNTVNKTVTPSVTVPKAQAIADNQAKQIEEKQFKETTQTNDKLLDTDEKIIKTEEKLTTVVEKLIGVFEKSLTKGIGPVTPTARAQELVDSKKLDYRTIGERFKDKIFGRGGRDEATGKRLGNKFDPESLRYKFGTMRGLAETTGLVKRDSTGFIANALAVREERKQKTEAAGDLDRRRSKTKLEAEVGESQKSSGNLQDREARINVKRAAGYSDKELEATTRGKKMFAERNRAADEVIAKDPTLKQEAKANEVVRKVRQAEANSVPFATAKPVKAEPVLVTPAKPVKAEPVSVTPAKPVKKENLVPFAGATARIEKDRKEGNAENTAEDRRQMNEQTGVLRKIEENTRSGKDIKSKKKDKEEKEEKKGGVLSGMMDSAKNLVGKKGGMLSRIASTGSKYLGKIGGVGKLAKGLGVGAIGALAGEGLQAGGEKLKESGYEQTGKAVGTAGTAAKYAGYGAMIGSVVPGVGTAIGGAAGGIIGAGKGIYDNYFKGGEKSGEVKSKTIKESGEYDLHMDPDTGKFIANGKEISGEEYTRLQNMPLGMDKVRAVKAAADNADKVANASAENAGMKETVNKQGDKTIVNAPTNIQKVNQNTYGKRYSRNSEWYDSRYRHRSYVMPI